MSGERESEGRRERFFGEIFGDFFLEIFFWRLFWRDFWSLGVCTVHVLHTVY